MCEKKDDNEDLEKAMNEMVDRRLKARRKQRRKNPNALELLDAQKKTSLRKEPQKR